MPGSLWARRSHGAWRPRYWRRAAVALGLLVFIPCAWTMHGGEHSYLMQNTGEALGIALLFATLVVPDTRDTRPLRAVRLLEHPLPVAVGVASYSLFLWHFPIIYWLQAHHAFLAGWAGLPANVAITAVVAGSLSALTYRFVERPALMHKRPTRDRETEPAAASLPAPAVEAALP